MPSIILLPQSISYDRRSTFGEFRIISRPQYVYNRSSFLFFFAQQYALCDGHVNERLSIGSIGGGQK